MTFRFLQRRLVNVGLSRYHSKVVRDYFDYQVKCRGYTGAVDFFKRVGTTIIHGIDPSTEKATWVATAFRYPKKLVFLRYYPVSVQFKVAKIARAIVYRTLEQRQTQKVLNGVVAPYSGAPDGIASLSDVMLSGLRGLVVPEWSASSMPLIGRQFTKTQSVSGTVTTKTYEPPIKESLDLLANTVFEQLPGIGNMFYPLYVARYFDEDRSLWGDLPDPPVVGEISAAQEGGGKLRMFAAPYTVFQCAITPLHDWLAGFRRQILSDCTYNQEDGALWAQSRLQSGLSVARVDLSTATCRFPLEAQVTLLRRLGVPEIWIRCFVALSRGRWKVNKSLRASGLFPDYLVWAVGQPLGIRPSMSLFSTAHNLVLRGLCFKNGLDPNSSFKILGDDVVLVPELYEPYCQLMASAGVPISWDKSGVSNVYSEFAGYSIHSETMVRPGQWKRSTPNNFSELCKWAEVPLAGEVPNKILKLQKFILFQNGLYNPPPDKLKMYLQANTALHLARLMPPEPLPPNVKFWDEGITEACINQLGDSVQFFPHIQSVADSLLPLSECGMYEHYLMLVNFSLSNVSIWHRDSILSMCLFYGHSIVFSDIDSGRLTEHEGANLLQSFYSSIQSYLWSPPLLTINEENANGIEILYRALHDPSSINKFVDMMTFGDPLPEMAM